jgi:hypothetical protein
MSNWEALKNIQIKNENLRRKETDLMLQKSNIDLSKQHMELKFNDYVERLGSIELSGSKLREFELHAINKNVLHMQFKNHSDNLNKELKDVRRDIAITNSTNAVAYMKFNK